MDEGYYSAQEFISEATGPACSSTTGTWTGPGTQNTTPMLEAGQLNLDLDMNQLRV